jgi:hypothetical protein
MEGLLFMLMKTSLFNPIKHEIPFANSVSTSKESKLLNYKDKFDKAV